MKVPLAGWGRFPRLRSELIGAGSPAAARAATEAAQGLIARGSGRAYGDAAVGVEQTLSLSGLRRLLAFDAAAGLLTAEAGVPLAEVIAFALPRGFYPYVVPGTQAVSIGGAIAADVHGKNHHREGGFGHYVTRLVLAAPDGSLVSCGPDENTELFRHTLGGMGLTGTIVEATIRLRPVETGRIRQHTVAAPNLTAAIAALEASESATYSVAWIDCIARGKAMGRSLVYTGEHAALSDLPAGTPVLPPRGKELPFPPLPFEVPGFVLNPLAMKAFNRLYWRQGRRADGQDRLVPEESYFFPLDRIRDWNRMYGGRGFTQHQCVIPTERAPAALGEMLGRITRAGSASFLAVLKKLGAGAGTLSFPLPGFTLALDFPIRKRTFRLLDELDEIVVRHGGRLYLAKDATQTRSTFAAGYPAAAQFRAFRHAIDPERRLCSHLARRLDL